MEALLKEILEELKMIRQALTDKKDSVDVEGFIERLVASGRKCSLDFNPKS